MKEQPGTKQSLGKGSGGARGRDGVLTEGWREEHRDFGRNGCKALEVRLWALLGRVELRRGSGPCKLHSLMGPVGPAICRSGDGERAALSGAWSPGKAVPSPPRSGWSHGAAGRLSEISGSAR